MKTIFGMLVVLCAAGLAGCGDKDSGPVGTWVVDHEAVITQNKDMFWTPAKARADELVAGAKEGLSEEDRAVVAAYQRSAAEGDAALKKALAGALKKMFDATFTLNADGTFVSSSREGGDAPDETKGTWAAAGAQVTLTPKTKNGKAVEGDDAKTKPLTLQGNTLSGKGQENGPMIVFKRK